MSSPPNTQHVVQTASPCSRTPSNSPWEAGGAELYRADTTKNFKWNMRNARVINNASGDDCSLFSLCPTLIYEIKVLVLPLKGQFATKSKIRISPLAWSVIYPSRLFWSELQSFWEICCRNDSLQYDGIKWHSACGAQTVKKMNPKG